MKIASFLITLLGNILIGAILLFFLLLALNGFSEKQATPAIILYVIWALIFSILAASLSVWTLIFLVNKKSFNSLLAGLISVGVFTIIGVAINFAGLIISTILASELR